MKIKAGKRVRIHCLAPDGKTYGTFHNRRGVVIRRTRESSSRWWVRLYGDPPGVETEFLSSELKEAK